MQVHDQFKVFVGSSIDELDSHVLQFTAKADVAAKSIGVEFLESKGVLVLSLGYATSDEDGYAARLTALPVGRFDAGSAASIAELEAKLARGAAAAGDVICHELYVEGGGEATAVFLLKA